MSATVLDLRASQSSASFDEIGPLVAYLKQLTGEPYLFARVSYGDELTLHLGSLRESHSAKLKDRRYGTYVLNLRRSPWVLKAGRQSVLLSSADGILESEIGENVRPMTRDDIDRCGVVAENARVISALPYLGTVSDGIGLRLVLSDGSVFTTPPTPPDTPDGSAWPELANWELLSPYGLLKVGPGVRWEFLPSEENPAMGRSPLAT